MFAAVCDGAARGGVVPIEHTLAGPVPGCAELFVRHEVHATRDARVTQDHFTILAANFGQSNRNFSQGDFTYDGIVNLNDFNVLASRFGQTVAPTGATMLPDDVELRDLMTELT